MPTTQREDQRATARESRRSEPRRPLREIAAARPAPPGTRSPLQGPAPCAAPQFAPPSCHSVDHAGGPGMSCALPRVCRPIGRRFMPGELQGVGTTFPTDAQWRFDHAPHRQARSCTTVQTPPGTATFRAFGRGRPRGPRAEGRHGTPCGHPVSRVRAGGSPPPRRSGAAGPRPDLSVNGRVHTEGEGPEVITEQVGEMMPSSVTIHAARDPQASRRAQQDAHNRRGPRRLREAADETPLWFTKQQALGSCVAPGPDDRSPCGPRHAPACWLRPRREGSDGT